MSDLVERARAALDGIPQWPWMPSHDAPSPGTRPEGTYDVTDSHGVEWAVNLLHAESVAVASLPGLVSELVAELNAALACYRKVAAERDDYRAELESRGYWLQREDERP